MSENQLAATNPEQSALCIERVVKTYGKGPAQVTALNNVDLEVTPGEFIAIMGSSGSGKSTLLHCCAGLTDPDQGSVAINGTCLQGLNDRKRTAFRRRHLGIVFQAFNLVPVLNARENVALPLTLDGQSRTAALAQADAMLETVGLTPRRDHRPDQLSGGEQQRVAIARALIAQPALVLADEPTGNLDSRSGTAICELLNDLHHKQQRTLVVVTHESEVARWADRVIILADGKIVDTVSGNDAHDARLLNQRFLDASPALQQGASA